MAACVGAELACANHATSAFGYTIAHGDSPRVTTRRPARANNPSNAPGSASALGPTREPGDAGGPNVAIASRIAVYWQRSGGPQHVATILPVASRTRATSRIAASRSRAKNRLLTATTASKVDGSNG